MGKKRVKLQDIVTDLLCEHDPFDSEVLILEEGIYSMTNDLLIKDYILWPLYKDIIGLSDPFHAYFELWRKGIKYKFVDDSSADLYVSNLKK